MAAAFLGKKLCPALSDCRFDQVGVLGPQEGLLGLALTSACGARPSELPCQAWRVSRALLWMPGCLLGLPLCCPAASGLRQGLLAVWSCP